MNKERKTSANSTYKKLAVQWLNEDSCFVFKFSEQARAKSKEPNHPAHKKQTRIKWYTVF